MKIDLKLTPDAVFACAKLLNAVVTSQQPPTEREQKLIRSMAIELNDRFAKDALKLKKRLDLFEAKKKTKVTLKYHDAWALEKLILATLHLIDEPYSVTLLRQLSGELNQKTS